MPKISRIQTNFSAGELGPHSNGRTDIEQYNRGLDKCYNYIPSIEGPLVRRPGTQFVSEARDSSKPSTLIPFKISDKQQYILEFSDFNIRFYTDEGRVVTSGTTITISNISQAINTGGIVGFPGFALRENSEPLFNEDLTTAAIAASVPVGSILQIGSPYSVEETRGLKYAQKGNKLYLTCSSRAVHVLTHYNPTSWTLFEFKNNDGPYFPYNTNELIGDGIDIKLNPIWQPATSVNYNTGYIGMETNGNLIADVGNAGGKIRIQTVGAHSHISGGRVYVRGVAGTVEANNSSLLNHESWPITVINSTTFDLEGPSYVNAYTGSGYVWAALLKDVVKGRNHHRSVGIIINSTRFWGYIDAPSNGNPTVNMGTARNPYELLGRSPASFHMLLDRQSAEFASQVFTDTSAIDFWQLGIWQSSAVVGYPQAITFHQDRLVLAGMPVYPDEFIASETGFYDRFSPSNEKGLQLLDTNALQFGLASDNKDSLLWAKSGNKGLLFGTLSNEFLVTPSGDNQALTPTNINAEVVGRYGSANVDAVKSGDAVIYVQNSQNKIRELNYFVNVNKHKSILINKYSEHITYPSVIKLAAQDEFYPMIYALRSDGIIAAMSFDRDEQTVMSGWAEFELGGQSDSGGTSPNVKSMAVIADSKGQYDQLWMVVQRRLNGTSVLSIEYMNSPFTPTTEQSQAKYLDAAAVYDSALVIASMTQGGSTVVEAISHNFSKNDRVLITECIGVNSSLVDINGIVQNSNLVNGKVFRVGTVVGNTFPIHYENSSYVDSTTYNPYLGGGKIRKLVSEISGLTHLRNEVVDVLADGAIQNNLTVNSGGILALQYPAAVVNIGLPYKSRGRILRPEGGGARGTSIGMTRKPYMIGFNLEYVGDFSYGESFDNLFRWDFTQADAQNADTATPLFKGIIRDGIESAYDFDGQICFEQSSPLPGMIKSITLLMDEFDV